MASTERQRAFAWMAIYTAGAAACLAPLLVVFQMAFLVPFGMAAACFVVLRAFLVRGGDGRSLPGALVGAVALTLVGPVAHAVAVDGAQSVGVVLWLLLSLFFASGVFYVRMRVRLMVAQRRGVAGASNRARWSCVLFHACLLALVPALAAVRLIPWAVLLAFAPALWRAAAGLRRRTPHSTSSGWAGPRSDSRPSSSCSSSPPSDRRQQSAVVRHAIRSDASRYEVGGAVFLW